MHHTPLHTSRTDPPGTLHVVHETDEIVALCLEGEFDLANAPRNHRGKRADPRRRQAPGARPQPGNVHRLVGHRSQAGPSKRTGAVLQLGTAAIVELVLGVSGIERVLPGVHTRAEAIDTIRQFGNERRNR